MIREDIKIQNPDILMQLFSNVPNEENILVDQTSNSKKENFDAANYNVPNLPIYSQALFPKYEEDRYGNLTLFTTSVFKPHESICATYLWTGENQCSIMESEAYDIEGNVTWCCSVPWRHVIF